MTDMLVLEDPAVFSRYKVLTEGQDEDVRTRRATSFLSALTLFVWYCRVQATDHWR